MSSRSPDKLEPRIQEVLDAIESYHNADPGYDAFKRHEHLHHLLIQLTHEEFNQVRFITAKVGGRDS